ncbi:GSCOCT00010653001.2-RA-CDS [Cotesia congregata]|uniref:Serine protease gastrulation defective-like n=1 Tax=Cotesia congregata TaxID=51543 RepID=A0A8J2EJM0_COTCN|nr:GSCOCT00010653001.2-RA-CDS [Cotesia congregata]CAG5075073.1 serine protease gastrulation defective-like [Cotesia congregata]
MSGVCKLLVIVFIINITTVKCYYNSSCSEIVSNIRHPKRNDTLVRIKIPNPPKNFRQLTLKVLYETREKFKNDYHGFINLRWPLAETMDRITSGKSLIYIVHLPMLLRIPHIIFVSLNDTPLCIIKKDPLKRVVELKHNLLPPQFNPASLPIISTTEATSTTSTTEAPYIDEMPKSSEPEGPDTFFRKELDELSKGCGHINSDDNFEFKDNVRLRQRQWPWLAAIYINSSTSEFHCSGTLISDRHILTAGHCTYYNDRKLTPNLLVVSLGRYRLDDWEEPLSDNYEVSSIDVHPDYNFGLTSEADLAILKLSRRVRFRPTVRHLCIKTDFEQGFGPTEELGYVAGWGDKTLASKENREIVEESSVAKLHVAPIISPEKCVNETRKLEKFITDNTFCARSPNGVSGPCNSDSGAGLAVAVFQKFYLRGVVSMLAVGKTALDCDHKDFVVYVDVYTYTYWILLKIFEE